MKPWSCPRSFQRTPENTTTWLPRRKRVSFPIPDSRQRTVVSGAYRPSNPKACSPYLSISLLCNRGSAKSPLRTSASFEHRSHHRWRQHASSKGTRQRLTMNAESFPVPFEGRRRRITQAIQPVLTYASPFEYDLELLGRLVIPPGFLILRWRYSLRVLHGE